MTGRNWAEADRCWTEFRTRRPDLPAGYVGSSRALQELGRHDEAEAVLAAAAERFPDDESVALTRGHLANARRDWPQALERWRRARERFADNPRSFVGGIQALQATGDAEGLERLLAQALAAVAAARDGNRQAEGCRFAELDIAKARTDWAGVKSAALGIVETVASPPVHVHLSLARALWHLQEPEKADEVAQRALAIDPRLADAWLIRTWVATARGDAELTLTLYRRLADLDPGTARWPLQAVRLLNWLGRVQESVDELVTVKARWPDDPVVREFVQNFAPAMPVGAAPAIDDDARDAEGLRTLLQRAPPQDARRRPIIGHDPSSEVIVAECPGAATVIFVFTGGADGLTVPLPVLDAYLAALPASCVYLKDFRRLRYLTGIGSLACDYAGTVQRLQSLKERLGADRVCTLGNCDGGFAAIRYGVDLDAERIVAFSPATHLPREDAAGHEHARRFKAVRLAALGPDSAADLRKALSSRPHRSRIDIFYDDSDVRDRAQARHLDGLPGVRLLPQPTPGDGRLLRQFALASPDWRLTLAELLGLSAEQRQPPEQAVKQLR